MIKIVETANKITDLASVVFKANCGAELSQSVKDCYLVAIIGIMNNESKTFNPKPADAPIKTLRFSCHLDSKTDDVTKVWYKGTLLHIPNNAIIKFSNDIIEVNENYNLDKLVE